MSETRPKTRLMAILNVTPDSFSDGGRLGSVEHAVEAAGRALAAGADILDIGGESTRPGARAVDVDTELERVIPAIEAVRRKFPDAVISIDTRKSPVAEAAARAGAGIINDVSGLQFDPAIAEVAARYGTRLVIMHSRGTPDVMQENPQYPDGVVTEIIRFFERQTQLALSAGLSRDAVILDPGFGFGKTLGHNLDIMRGFHRFRALGCPLLAGTSRKRFLALGSDQPAPAERDALTAASLAELIRQGASYVRVHDAVAMAPVVRFLDAVYAGGGVLAGR